MCDDRIDLTQSRPLYGDAGPHVSRSKSLKAGYESRGLITCVGPLGPSGSSSSQHRRTPELILQKGHASCQVTFSPPRCRGSRQKPTPKVVSRSKQVLSPQSGTHNLRKPSLAQRPTLVDPKKSMAFLQNQFRCPTICWELEEPKRPKGWLFRSVRP